MTNRKPWSTVLVLCFGLALGACSSAEDDARRETVSACRAYGTQAETCMRSILGSRAESAPQLGAAREFAVQAEKAPVQELAALRRRCEEGAASYRTVCR